jgi:hypothetical protein
MTGIETLEINLMEGTVEAVTTGISLCTRV